MYVCPRKNHLGVHQVLEYIRYWSIQPFIIDLVSPTTYVVCIIFGGTHSLKSTPNERFSEKLVMAILFTLRVFAGNLLIGNRRRKTFCILFWCLAWGSNLGFTSNKPTHYLLDYGDFSGSLACKIGCLVCGKITSFTCTPFNLAFL